MVEVFRTNVKKRSQANLIIAVIEKTFSGLGATIDLEDCDRVLRVQANECRICPVSLIRIVKEFGFDAEILEDQPHYASSFQQIRL